MKVLIIAQHVNFFRNLDTVIRELSHRGHQVVFLYGGDQDSRAAKTAARKVKPGKVLSTRGLTIAESETPGFTSGYRPRPSEASCLALRYGRQVMNRALCLRKCHPSPTRVVESLEREMPSRLAAAIVRPQWKYLLRSKTAMRVWRRIEDASPPSPTLISLLSDIAPQVMLVTPTVWPKDVVEADYLHAARSIGVPTLGYFNSWDNLTSKGTIHVLPDQFIVWNEPIAREAVELHYVPPEIIRIAGAPHLDHFFAMRVTSSREDICGQMGCPADRPYVTYLCSSRTLVTSEVGLVTRLSEAIARAIPDRTPTVVVRPHPSNSVSWAGYDRPGIVVYPREGDQADSRDSWQPYFNQLANGLCVVGLNSTAFFEAVVAGQPCLTIVADEFRAAQGHTGHFRHLLEGDFLEVAGDVAGVALRIARIVGGADEKREQRGKFARRFLRPCGLDRSVAQVIADLIERSAIPDGSTGLAPSAEPIPGLTPRAQAIR